MDTVETDYLVVGAGASGMAFTDALVASCDAEVVLVDRRPAPGGHWRDAYPFVRLHVPSAFYGVNSTRLGDDRVDDSGPNQGMYELASAAEICSYFEQVLSDVLLPTGGCACSAAPRSTRRAARRPTGCSCATSRRAAPDASSSAARSSTPATWKARCRRRPRHRSPWHLTSGSSR